MHTVNCWIFQANPNHYDIDAALAELDQIVWRVPQYTEDIRPEDAVAVWRSGKDAGVIGLGTVLTAPALAKVAAVEGRFVLDDVAEGGDETRVVVAAIPIAPVPKATVAAAAGMSDHPIMHTRCGPEALPRRDRHQRDHAHPPVL